MKTSAFRSCATGPSARRSNPAHFLLWLALLILLPLGCSKGEKVEKAPAKTTPTPTLTPAPSRRPTPSGQIFTIPAKRVTPRTTFPRDNESTPATHSVGAPPKATPAGPPGKTGSGTVQTSPALTIPANLNATSQPASPGATPGVSAPGETPTGKTTSETGKTAQGREDVLRQFVNSAEGPASTSGEEESANSNGASGTSDSGQPTPTPEQKWTHPTPAPTIGPPTETPPAPTPESGQASVYLFPPNMPAVAGRSFTLMVMIDSTEHPVADYGISIMYNPLIVRLDGFRPGDDPLLGNPTIKFVEKDRNGQPLGVVHILKVQTASKTQPIGTKIMVSRLDFTALGPGNTTVQVAGADIDNTEQNAMQVTTLGKSQVSITAPSQP